MGSRAAGALVAALPAAACGPFSGWGSLGTSGPCPCSHVFPSRGWMKNDEVLGDGTPEQRGRGPLNQPPREAAQ